MSAPFEENQTVEDINILHLSPNPDFADDAAYLSAITEVNQWLTVLWGSMTGGKTLSGEERDRLVTGLIEYYKAVRSRASGSIFAATVELENLGENVFGMKDAALWTLRNELDVYANLILELRDAENEVRLSQ